MGVKNHKKWQNALFKGPQSQKSADSHKTGKNTEKVNQELIKKWSKTQSKTNQNVFGEAKKAYFWVSKSAKMTFFDMMRVKTIKKVKK